MPNDYVYSVRAGHLVLSFTLWHLTLHSLIFYIVYICLHIPCSYHFHILCMYSLVYSSIYLAISGFHLKCCVLHLIKLAHIYKIFTVWVFIHMFHLSCNLGKYKVSKMEHMLHFWSLLWKACSWGSSLITLLVSPKLYTLFHAVITPIVQWKGQAQLV